MANLLKLPAWVDKEHVYAVVGDPLGVLIIHDAKTHTDVVLRCRPVGILEVEQKRSRSKKERNGRIFVVPDRSPLETDGRPPSA